MKKTVPGLPHREGVLFKSSGRGHFRYVIVFCFAGDAVRECLGKKNKKQNGVREKSQRQKSDKNMSK